MTELIKNEDVNKKPVHRQTICKICDGELKDASFIERCQHVFCLLCIQKHAVVSNKCPVCDKEFTCYLSNISNNLKCQVFYVKKPTISVEESTKEKVESYSCDCQNHQQNTACNHKFCRLCFKQTFLKLKKCSECCKRLKELITKKNNKMNKMMLTSQSNVLHIRQLYSQSAVLKNSSSHHKVKSEEKQLIEQIELTENVECRIGQTENVEYRIGQTEDKNNELRFSISSGTAVLNRDTFVHSDSTIFNSRTMSLEKQSRLTFKHTFNENIKLDEQIENCKSLSSSILQDENPGQSNCDINFSMLDKIRSLSHEMENKYSERIDQSLSVSSIVQSSSNGVKKELNVGLCIEPPKTESEKHHSDAIIQEPINKSIKSDDPANSYHVIPTSSNIHETPKQQNINSNFCNTSQKIKSEDNTPQQQISGRGIETNNKTEVVNKIDPHCPTLYATSNRVELTDLSTDLSKIQSDLKQLKEQMLNKSTRKYGKPANDSSFEPILTALEDKNYHPNNDSHQTFWEGREYNGKSKRRKNRHFPRGNQGHRGRRNSQSEGCSCGGQGCRFCRSFWQHETRHRGNHRHYDVVEYRGRSRHRNNVQRGNFCIRGSYSIQRNSNSSRIHVNATYNGDCPMNEMLQLMTGCDESQNTFRRMSNYSNQDYNEPVCNYRDRGYHPYHAERGSRRGYRKRQRN